MRTSNELDLEATLQPVKNDSADREVLDELTILNFHVQIQAPLINKITSLTLITTIPINMNSTLTPLRNNYPHGP